MHITLLTNDKCFRYQDLKSRFLVEFRAAEAEYRYPSQLTSPLTLLPLMNMKVLNGAWPLI